MFLVNRRHWNCSAIFWILFTLCGSSGNICFLSQVSRSICYIHWNHGLPRLTRSSFAMSFCFLWLPQASAKFQCRVSFLSCRFYMNSTLLVSCILCSLLLLRAATSETYVTCVESTLAEEKGVGFSALHYSANRKLSYIRGLSLYLCLLSYPQKHRQPGYSFSIYSVTYISIYFLIDPYVYLLTSTYVFTSQLID